MFALAAECNVNGRGARLKPRNGRARAKAGGKAATARSGAIDAPRLLAHEAGPMTLAALPLPSIAGACRGAGRAARSGAGARRRRARRPLRRPGGDGADPRRRQGRLLHGPRVEPARSSHRRPLSETLAGYGGPLSRRRRSGGHHSGRRGDRPSALPRRRDQGPRRIDRPRAHQDGAAACPRASPPRRSRMADRRRSARQRSSRAMARRARATGRRAARCAASRSPFASRRPRFSSGPPIPPEGRPAPAAAIPARRSGRRTDRPRSRSSPGRRRAHGRGCGGLTQGPLLAPLKGWIEETERALELRE